MMGIESLDEQLHAVHARREAEIDNLCRALIAIDDASRDLDYLIDRKLDETASR